MHHRKSKKEDFKFSFLFSLQLKRFLYLQNVSHEDIFACLLGLNFKQSELTRLKF